MKKATISDRRAFLRDEHSKFDAARRRGDTGTAWHHLERFHIVAQPLVREHLRSHWFMLCYAAQLRDLREVFGQSARLLLVLPGNLLQRLPVGNNGRARLSPFKAMPVPSDLRRFL